jgi:LAGLIDADG-like domain
MASKITLTDLGDIDIDRLASRIGSMTDDEKRQFILSLPQRQVKLAQASKRVQRRLKTPDELWEWIRKETGVEIPRVAVCDDHCAPFDFVWDAYSNKERALLLMANREGGKTLSVSIVHFANAETKPGYEGITFGAILPQAKKAYEYIKGFITTTNADGDQVPNTQIAGEPTRDQTRWKSGSKVGVIVGTKAGVNSPHPQTVHADEIDIMEEEVWSESQPKHIKIPTPNGQTEFGQLKIGDVVFGRNGLPTTINKISELGYKDVFEIELTDGRKTKCCGDHLWTVGMKSGSSKRWVVKRLNELGELRRKDPRGGWIYKYVLPQQGCAEYVNTDELAIDPYVLGVFLGDGCLTGREPEFRDQSGEVAKRVDERLPAGYSVKRREHGIYEPSYAITKDHKSKAGNLFWCALAEMNLLGKTSHTKFIPNSYLEASANTRIELLRGLMDTDGSFTKDPYFSSVSENLASGVREIVLSLGGRALMRKKKTSQSSFNNCGYIYEVSTSLPDGLNPFAVEKKAQKFKHRTKTLAASIRAIRFVGKMDCRCIGVDATDGLYLTEDFIVTHNSRNMAGSKTIDGDRIPAQDIATSTRKSNKGLMQKLIDEVEDSEDKGHKPAWKVYAYCFVEVAKEVSCCRQVDPVQRVRRLVENGEDPGKLCECDRVVKGEWDEKTPRTLESVCKGRLFKSRGWLEYDDIVGKFMQNSQAVWEAQMDCRRPSADGVYLPTFTRERFCLRGWIPRPEYGRIWMGVDWGGSEASSILWIQGPLYQPIEIMGFTGRPIVVPQRAYVVFDEIHEANVGATKLADEVVRREIALRNQFPGWKISGRFADMAGKQQRDDWREHNPPLWTAWHIDREFQPTVDCIQGLVSDARWFVDANTCINVMDDAESWCQKKGKEVHDEATHTMASNRYCLTNVEVLERRSSRTRGQTTALPVVAARPAAILPGAMPATGVLSTGYESERWRESMGYSITPGGGIDAWRP